MTEDSAPAVWGMFNGEKGDQLPALTRAAEVSFPPKVGSDGWIAIGWPAIGDMKMWRDDYKTYFLKFQSVYPCSDKRVMATQANIPWNFAFEMKVGDWVICPCSSERLLLIGRVSGDYEADWWGTPGVRADFVHFRRVHWLHVIQANDPRYSKFNRIGQLTLTRQRLTAEQLQDIINGAENHRQQPEPRDRETARQRAAERLAEFRQRTGGRGSASNAELLEESRASRLHALTGDSARR
jgi:hypothetical protein